MMNPKIFKPYVGGRYTETPTKYWVRSPWDNSEIAQVHLAGESELEEALVKAESAKTTMKELPSYQRFAILTSIADGLADKRDELGDILAQEAGKPIKLALGEVDRAIQTFKVAAEESKRLPAELLSLDWTPAGRGKEGIVKYFPVGIVGGIAPFNFPLNLSVHKIAPAIASGCPIILKPARSTPLSSLLLAGIIDRTELPKGALSVLPLDRNIGNTLVTDPRINLLSFTGSPEVGWAMKGRAGRKKVVLELGGNAGAIITPSANIEQAVDRCITGGFAYSGQVCIHTQRIFVHQSIFNRFAELFSQKANLLKSGSPLDPETDISAMIDEANAKRVEEWVNEAVSDGAKILTGGKRKGTYYPPTVLTNTSPEHRVCSHEVFGPVVTIEPYNQFADAVKLLNNSQYGLQAGVFTNQLDEMNYAYLYIETGGVIINDVPTFRVDHMPYGGIKNSGLGREGVRYAMTEMLEPKLLVKPIL